MRTILLTLACAASAAAQQFDSAGWALFDPMGVPAPSPIGRVFVADVDLDRDPDMLCEDGSLFINGSSGLPINAMWQTIVVPGTTTPRVQLSYQSPSGLFFGFSNKGAFADMDLDGDADFVMACSTGVLPTFQDFFRPIVLENLVSSTTPVQFVFGSNFSAPEIDLPSGLSPRCIVVADLNGDLFPDVVTASSMGIRVYANQPAPTPGLRILNDVTAAMLPLAGQFFGIVTDLAVGDFEGDGDPDLAIATGWPLLANSSPSCVAINPGVFTLPFAVGPVLQNPHAFTQHAQNSIAIGDLNGTGPLDVVIGSSGQDDVYLDPTGIVTTATSLPSSHFFPPDVAIADIDGDALNDIVFANKDQTGLGNDGKHQLYVNTGGGTFVNATVARLGALEAAISFACERIDVTDFDFDGDIDLVFSGAAAGQTFRLYRNRQLSVATTVTLTGGTQWDFTNRLACDEGYNTAAPPATISLAGLFMTVEPIGYVFPGTQPFPIVPVPLLSGSWIAFGTFLFNLPGATNGVVSVLTSIPRDPNLVGLPLFTTALMASTYSNSLRIANVTEVGLP